MNAFLTLICSTMWASIAFASDDALLQVSSRQDGNAASCTNVKIPPQLCTKCHLRPHDDEGKFFTSYNKDIIDIDTDECAQQMKKYVDLNPCDTLRAKYFDEYKTKTFAYQRLAQFMYTICEQCCDMVTVGSLPSEYKERLANDTLYTISRGNSPAHFRFDICKMFPNITRFTGPFWKIKDGLPKLCPLAESWYGSKYASKWVSNPDADGIPRRLLYSLGQTEKLFGCRNKRVWQDCVNMERAQGRV